MDTYLIVKDRKGYWLIEGNANRLCKSPVGKIINTDNLLSISFDRMNENKPKWLIKNVLFAIEDKSDYKKLYPSISLIQYDSEYIGIGE